MREKFERRSLKSGSNKVMHQIGAEICTSLPYCVTNASIGCDLVVIVQGSLGGLLSSPEMQCSPAQIDLQGTHP